MRHKEMILAHRPAATPAASCRHHGVFGALVFLYVVSPVRGPSGAVVVGIPEWFRSLVVDQFEFPAQQNKPSSNNARPGTLAPRRGYPLPSPDAFVTMSITRLGSSTLGYSAANLGTASTAISKYS